MDDLFKSIVVSASGMRVQGERMRVLAENMANADSVPHIAGQEPYRRKVLTFKNQLDRSLGVELVEIATRDFDKSDFGKRLDPGHPGAGADGYVQLPNVNGLIEIMDMREAQRSYEANLAVIETAKSMLMRTIDVLR